MRTPPLQKNMCLIITACIRSSAINAFKFTLNPKSDSGLFSSSKLWFLGTFFDEVYTYSTLIACCSKFPDRIIHGNVLHSRAFSSCIYKGPECFISSVYDTLYQQCRRNSVTLCFVYMLRKQNKPNPNPSLLIPIVYITYVAYYENYLC